MTGLSRNDFYLRYGVPRGTLQNWESARFGGLTEKGAKAIIRAFHAEGIYCELAWLLFGSGNAPKFTNNSNTQRNTVFKEHIVANDALFEAETNLITKEVLLFRTHHQHSIDIIVTDDAMQPYWQPGDYIAGVKRYKHDIQNTINAFCILQTQKYGTLLRKVLPGDEEGLYHLMMTNTETTVAKPFIYNVPLISSAPVIWTRRLDIISN